jgi:hypothetical protein
MATMLDFIKELFGLAKDSQGLLSELYNLNDEKKVNAEQRFENPGKRCILFTCFLKSGT